MLDITQTGKKNKKNLIIFLHGLTGDTMTWVNNNGKSFADLLLENKAIRKKFDIGHFTYFSKFINLRPVRKILGIFRSLNTGRHNHVEINLNIAEITDLLETEIRVRASNYEEILLIGHSLGGLISKSLILRRLNSQPPTPKITKFISLAVPHNGAVLAVIASRLLDNAQITDLDPLNEAIHNLNDAWIKTPHQSLPKTIYFHGLYDDIVVRQSSVGYQVENQDVQFFEADHTTICKPESSSSSVYIAVENILTTTIDEQDIREELAVKRLEDNNAFDDEYFVLKLLIADISRKTVKHAKNCFYNAEFVKKVVLNKKIMSLTEFESLYNLIEALYQNGFAQMTAGTIKDSRALVAYVYDRIEKEDQQKLKSIAAITFVHKTGMLHQLANSLDRDIWWKDGQELKDIEDFQKQQDKP